MKKSTIIAQPNDNSSANLSRSRRSGFTLVEVILSLSLSVVILGLLSMATSIFLLDLEEDRVDLERARAARAVLDVIANDLRSAIQFKPMDETALDEAVEAVKAATGQEEEEGETEEPEEVVVEHPGLAGSSDYLTLDISRLPRRDQFTPTIDPKEGIITSFPSEVKNVTYQIGQVDPNNSNRNSETGLMRLEYDRAAKRYAEDTGGRLPGFEMMSTEVTSIQFRYFDGRDWFTEWDSNEKQTLPVAIEITVLVDPRSRSQILAGVSDIEPVPHVKVVHLPIAESIQEIEAREEALNFVE